MKISFFSSILTVILLTIATYSVVAQTEVLSYKDSIDHLIEDSETLLELEQNNNRFLAVEKLVLALEVAYKTDDFEIQSELNDRIGDIYDLLRLKEQAKVYYTNAFQIREENSLNRSLYRSYLNLGIVEYRYGHLISALESVKSALKRIPAEAPASDLANIHFWMGSTFNYLKDEAVDSSLEENLDSAVKHANLAKRLFLDLKDTIGVIKSNNLLGSIYTQSNEPANGLAPLENNLALIKALEQGSGKPLASEYYATTYSRLSSLNQRLGRIDAALQYSNLKYGKVIGILMQKERDEIAQLTEDFRTDKQLDQAEAIAFLQSKRAKTFGITSGILIVILLISYLIFLQMIQRKKLENLQALIKGEEQERQRLASDLHDGIGVLLTSIKMRLSSFEDAVDDPKAYHESLEKIDDACVEVRRVSHNLSPASLNKLGLEEAILDLFDQVRKHKIQTEVSWKLQEPLNAQRDILIYRIIQELINNSLKYADAKQLNLQAYQEKEQVHFIYEDNGNGFDKQKVKEGLGLKSIASRVDIMKGKFSFNSTLDKGSIFQITIPING